MINIDDINQSNGLISKGNDGDMRMINDNKHNDDDAEDDFKCDQMKFSELTTQQQWIIEINPFNKSVYKAY